jgi:hypothetical protein
VAVAAGTRYLFIVDSNFNTFPQHVRALCEEIVRRKVYGRMVWESPHSYWRLLRNLGAFMGYARHQRNAKKVGGE